jgi:hypothetical protein
VPEDVAPPLLDRVAQVLAGLDERPLAEHVEVFDTVHRTLQDALASLDGI